MVISGYPMSGGPGKGVWVGLCVKWKLGSIYECL